MEDSVDFKENYEILLRFTTELTQHGTRDLFDHGPRQNLPCKTKLPQVCLLATHLNGPWHVICVQEGSPFCSDVTLQLRCGLPVRLRSPPQQGHLRAQPFVCSAPHSFASSGMLHGPKRAWLSLAISPELPTSRAPTFTVANIHINSERAKRRYVCIVLLLLIRDVCLKLGAVVLTSNFHKGAERELPPGGSESQRRISPLESRQSSAPLASPGRPSVGSRR